MKTMNQYGDFNPVLPILFLIRFNKISFLRVKFLIKKKQNIGLITMIHEGSEST